MFVGSRRILRGVVLWIVLAVVLWIVLAGLLWGVLAGLLWIILSIVLLWTESRRFLPVPPWEASLRRWWGVLVGVTLLWGWNEGQIGLCNPPSAVHGNSSEDSSHDQEGDYRDSNTCTNAQPIPANHIIVAEWGESQLEPG